MSDLKAKEGRHMSRKRSQAVDTYGDSALTWFFIGVLVVAAVAGLLGQVTVG